MNARRNMLMLPVDGAGGASTRYRVLAYRPALERAGFRTRVRFPMGQAAAGPLRLVWRAADMLRDVVAPSPDLLFLHRKLYPPSIARRLGRSRRTVIFDMDDALDLPPPGRVADPAMERRYRRNFEATVASADLVLCGNAELARRVPHERCALLPTAIDVERFAPQQVAPPRAATLGWVGHSDNLPYLEALAPALREVRGRHPEMRLVVVADRPPDLPGLDVEFRRWTLESELSCFGGIAVGLMPLDDSVWSRNKCAFKAIQYMALGIPTVASPVGMNREVLRDGENGFLPADDAGWVEALDRLLGDTTLAARIGAAGRVSVVAEYALEFNAGKLVGWLEQLTDEAAHVA